VNNSASERRIIVVPISLYGIHPDALRALVRIAHQLDSSLLGLLLEDSRLHQAAALPFATEISLGSGRERSFSSRRQSASLKFRGDDTRRRLHDMALQGKVELAFEDLGLARLHSVLDRDGQRDIFFPARQRWQPQAGKYGFSTPPLRRLAVVLTHAAQDQRVLEVAQTLMRAGLVFELYLVSAGSPSQSQLELLYRPGARICIQSNLEPGPAAIIALIRRPGYNLLLLPRDALRDIPAELLDTALDQAGSQVMVIN
jgi:hypothetical protein